MLVGLCALKTNALATRTVGDGGVVDANVDAVADGVDEAVFGGCLAVHVVHVAIGGVGVLCGISIKMRREGRLEQMSIDIQ
jgi:hypothetical protein